MGMMSTSAATTAAALRASYGALARYPPGRGRRSSRPRRQKGDGEGSPPRGMLRRPLEGIAGELSHVGRVNEHSRYGGHEDGSQLPVLVQCAHLVRISDEPTTAASVTARRKPLGRVSPTSRPQAAARRRRSFRISRRAPAHPSRNSDWWTARRRRARGYAARRRTAQAAFSALPKSARASRIGKSDSTEKCRVPDKEFTGAT